MTSPDKYKDGAGKPRCLTHVALRDGPSLCTIRLWGGTVEVPASRPTPLPFFRGHAHPFKQGVTQPNANHLGPAVVPPAQAWALRPPHGWLCGVRRAAHRATCTEPQKVQVEENQSTPHTFYNARSAVAISHGWVYRSRCALSRSSGSNTMRTTRSGKAHQRPSNCMDA